MPDPEVLIRGALLPQGDGLSKPTDIAIAGGRISSMGAAAGRPPSNTIDAGGRVCLPGFVDAHCHAAAAIFEPSVAQALLRQGVTTIVVGQDGIGPAPSDQASFEWSAGYFAGLDGASARLHPGSVADWLAAYDGAVPVNVAVFVPHGSLRYMVAGPAQRPCTESEIAQMAHLLDDALCDGAVGMSTGLEYVPAAWADRDELESLLRVVAIRDRIHSSHMRGYEAAAPSAVSELVSLAQTTGALTHIAHYHGDDAMLSRLLDDAMVPITFDSYDYTRGCSLLTMVALPTWIPLADQAAALSQLGDATTQARVLDHMAGLSALWPRVTIAWASGADPLTGEPLDWTAGVSLPDICARWGTSPEQAVIRLLIGTNLRATTIFQQPPSDSEAAISHLADRPEHMAGSDAVYVPFDGTGAPHPRGWGAMVRWLKHKVIDDATWTWSDAVDHLSTRAVTRFELGKRGRLGVGQVADLVLIDPAQLSDTATYESPRSLATGIDDVYLAGVPVLQHGQLTGRLNGGGLRWNTSENNDRAMARKE